MLLFTLLETFLNFRNSLLTRGQSKMTNENNSAATEIREPSYSELFGIVEQMGAEINQLF